MHVRDLKLSTRLINRLADVQKARQGFRSLGYDRSGEVRTDRTSAQRASFSECEAILLEAENRINAILEQTLPGFNREGASSQD